MEKAIIIYQSKKGTTRQLGNEIGNYLKSIGLKTSILPVDDYEGQDLSSFSYIFLGCWTKGLMVIAQHPDREWKDLVTSLDIPENAKLAFFTTYKIATGSMFSRMQKCIPVNGRSSSLKIKSRDGHLSDRNISMIDQYLSQEA